jgi:hypothetical protein
MLSALQHSFLMKTSLNWSTGNRQILVIRFFFLFINKLLLGQPLFLLASSKLLKKRKSCCKQRSSIIKQNAIFQLFIAKYASDEGHTKLGIKTFVAHVASLQMTLARKFSTFTTKTRHRRYSKPRVAHRNLDLEHAC